MALIYGNTGIWVAESAPIGIVYYGARRDGQELRLFRVTIHGVMIGEICSDEDAAAYAAITAALPNPAAACQVASAAALPKMSLATLTALLTEAFERGRCAGRDGLRGQFREMMGLDK